MSTDLPRHTRPEPWWQRSAQPVDTHTAIWVDGLRLSRLAKHRKQLWIEIEYQGMVHEIWLGKRTFKVGCRRQALAHAALAARRET